MQKNERIYVAGHTGLLGSALVRLLRARGFVNIITAERVFDLTDKGKVNILFKEFRPDYVFMSAAKVGSIAENIRYPVEFFTDNVLMQNNVFSSAQKAGVKKLLFFSANCCYPRDAIQPTPEESFMTGRPEPTNETYSLAKIAGVKMCQSYNTEYGTRFESVVLASLYGPNDHFGTSRAHVIADLIHKLSRAKKLGLPELILWGDGSPLREYMYVDDAADAALFLMNREASNNNEAFINAGTGEEISIKDLAFLISSVVGYTGSIKWDISRPNGIPRKLIDSEKIHQLGWHHKTSLRHGIELTYKWYLENVKSGS